MWALFSCNTNINNLSKNYRFQVFFTLKPCGVKAFNGKNNIRSIFS